MKSNRATLFLGFALWFAHSAEMQAADTTTVAYPFSGVIDITRVGGPPDFPRNVKIHVVKIDLTAPFVSFMFTPHSGTRDTVRETTLQYLNDMGAQVAINGSFFLPFPSTDLNAALVGFAASNGNVYSPFELPTQNYAIVRDSPAINIDPTNNASIVHRDPAYSDGTCYALCQVVDGLHILENVTLWNAFAGSGQIVTNGLRTIPCYVDATHPDCPLVGPGNGNYSNSNSWYELINARTSIGLSCDNKTLVLFTVDATNGSSGMKVSEVADLLISDYGVCNALNMDGGGSTSLAMVDPVTGIGGLVNSSSDNPNGRTNASGLAVFAATCGGPVITGASANPNVLWPPTNKFVPVTIGYSVTDNCDTAPACSLSVTATDSGGGINNPASSSLVVDAHTVELLASRNGGGDGRVYSVEISCKDKLPLSSSTTVAVTVPHDQGQ